MSRYDISRIQREGGGSYVITITDTASEITNGKSNSLRTLKIYNNSSNVVYVGDSTVSTTTGYPIPAGGTFEITLLGGQKIYAVVGATLTADVRVYEIIHDL